MAFRLPERGNPSHRKLPIFCSIALGTPYVHVGKAPYTCREIELSKGQHMVTVVAADAAHVVLAQPAPVSVSFTVK
jgi:hypothetical protein